MAVKKPLVSTIYHDFKLKVELNSKRPEEPVDWKSQSSRRRWDGRWSTRSGTDCFSPEVPWTCKVSVWNNIYNQSSRELANPDWLWVSQFLRWELELGMTKLTRSLELKTSMRSWSTFQEPIKDKFSDIKLHISPCHTLASNMLSRTSLRSSLMMIVPSMAITRSVRVRRNKLNIRCIRSISCLEGELPLRVFKSERTGGRCSSAASHPAPQSPPSPHVVSSRPEVSW